MVTVAVLGIILSIAAPNISTQLANQRVKSTTATLNNALKEAKVESVIRRQPITVSYDNESSPKSIIIKGLDAQPIASYSYDAKSSIKTATTTKIITFEPSKRVTAAVIYTICDSNSAASSRQLVVSSVASITSQLGGSCP
ncbi:pilus assembly protein [Psychrobacter frigidicola]|uniref:Type II secretion system protein H n=2 Tax=Psychrobacter frigidicola TaxID=45611 RepID=A0A5C7A197_9GAMM|nr:pilus assembly protein [Psychrobacter frigidicola]